MAPLARALGQEHAEAAQLLGAEAEGLIVQREGTWAVGLNERKGSPATQLGADLATVGEIGLTGTRLARQAVALEKKVERRAVEDAGLLDELQRLYVLRDELPHEADDRVVGHLIDVDPQGHREAQFLGNRLPTA